MPALHRPFVTHAVLAQTHVDRTTSEIARFRPLLDQLDLPTLWRIPQEALRSRPLREQGSHGRPATAG